MNGQGAVFLIISASGRVAVWNGNGAWTVTAPDGSTVGSMNDAATGQWTIAEADGTITTLTADGTLVSATGSDGTITETFEANQVVTTRLTKPDGSVTLTLSDGTTIATQGRTITTTLASGVMYTRDGYGRVFQQDNAQADKVQLSAQGVVVQTLENSVVLTWQAGGRFIEDLGTGRTIEDAPNGEQVIAQTNGDRLTAGITGFTWTEHADGTWTRSWPMGLTASVFPAASDGTANPAASVSTTIAKDSTGALVVTVPDGSIITTADAFTATPGTPVVTLATGSSAVEQTDHALVITTAADAQGRFTVATWAPDGTVTVATQQYPSNAEGSVNLNGMPSFVEQWAYAPDGTAILITPGADIAGPENTTISTTVTQVTTTDGTGTTTESDGTLDANHQPKYKTTVQSVDGTTVITQADGASQTTFLDGSAQSQAADGTLRHWAADGKTLTTTLTDSSVVDRSANGALTVTLPTGGSSLLTQHADGSWSAMLSGIPWTWANNGSGAIITVATDGTMTAQQLDGTTVTTTPDGTMITQQSNGRTVQQNLDGTVLSQSASGARWQEEVAQGTVTVASASGATTQMTPAGTFTTWAVDGTVTQTTDTAGSSMTWGTDGSQTSVSATGVTTTRSADHTLTITTPTGESVSRGPDGSVTASGLSSNALGSYDLGSGTTAAPNGTITVTLDDGSTLTEQANGVVTLQAHDGTHTTWTPPGVSSVYPNGFVTRTHADGSSEGWYTADETRDATGGWHQHPDALYVRLASPTAPTNTHVYGNGVQMQVESGTTALPLTAVTPNGAVLTAGAGGLTASGVRTETQHALETRSDVVIKYGTIVEDPATGVRSPLAVGGMMPSWSQPSLWPPAAPSGPLSPRTAGAATDGAALPVSLMHPYHLSDPGGAALAQLAASGKQFAIGASLDHPETLWTGNTVEEQQVLVTRTVSVTTVTNVLVIHIDRVSVYDSFGNYVGYAMTGWHPEYQQISDPPVSHDEQYQDGWDYIIDGVTHHSATRLNVYAITPPADSGLTASFVPYDPNATYATDPTPQTVDFSQITDLQGLQNDQGITDHYSFKLDGVAYVSDLLPPDVSVKPLSTIPALPAFPTGGESMTTLSPTLWLTGLSGRATDRTLSLAADRPDSQALTVGAPTRPTVVTERLALQTLINPVTGQEDQVTFTPDPWTPPSQPLPVPVAFISGLFKGAWASGADLAGSVGAIIQEMGKIVPDSADLEQTIFNPNYRAAFVGEQLTYHTLWQRISQKYGDVSDLQNEMLTLQMERVVNGDNFHTILLALDKGGAVGAQTRVLLMLAVASLSDEANRTSFVEAALRKVGVLTPEVEAKLQGGTSAAAQSNEAEARGYIAGRVFTELVLLAAPAAKSFQAVRVGTAAQLIDAAAINASQKAGLAMESVAVAEQAQLADALNAGRMPADIPVTKLELAVHRSLRVNYGDAQALALQNATYEGATQARAALGTLVLKGDGAVTLAKDAEQLTLRLVAKLRNRYQVVLSPASVEQLGNVVMRATLARAAQKGVAVGNQFLQDLYATMQAVAKSGQKLGFSPTAYIEDVVHGMYVTRGTQGFKTLMAQFAGQQDNLGIAEQWRWASWWQRTHAANPITDIEEFLQAANRPIDARLQDGTLVEVKAGGSSVPKPFSPRELDDIKEQARNFMRAQNPGHNVEYWIKNYGSAWQTHLQDLAVQLNQEFAGKNVQIIFHSNASW